MSIPTSAIPISPGSESCEKQRFALLLDINHELLYESILIQSTQQQLKNENALATGNATDRKATEEENLFQQDYFQYVLLPTSQDRHVGADQFAPDA